MKNVIISCNTKNKLILEKISLTLIKNKLSSCISIVKNIKFIYRYKRKICKEKEYKIFIKTNNKKIFAVKKYIQLYEKVLVVKVYDK